MSDSFEKKVLANISSWIDLAHKQQITWEQASLMINSFELGIAELSNHYGLSINH